jgi:hypothetical protein
MDRWKQRKIKYIRQLGGRCHSCGLELTENNYCVFDFHHTNPHEKEYMWTKLRLFSDSRIQEELSKCILLCANCHRLAHHDLYFTLTPSPAIMACNGSRDRISGEGPAPKQRPSPKRGRRWFSAPPSW